MSVDHFIKPLTQTQLPRSVMVMAVASRLGGDQAGYTQTWRCASVHFRRTPKDGPPKTLNWLSYQLDGCWDLVHGWARKKGLTFLWVHDLHWTARVTRMLESLPERGWQLDALSLNPGASWMVWRRGAATLKVADVMTVWPASIDQIGKWFGMGRKQIPDPGADVTAWNSYVTRERDILVAAVESYLQWVQDNELGTLAVTGSTQAWKAFRRRFLTHGILVHHDEELRAMERRAMWTGRCEAWWRGTLLKEVADEWDFSMAHNAIGETESLPVFPHRPLASLEDLRAVLAGPHYAILAEIEVDIDEPCLPMEQDGAILWPTGHVTTTLWSPELRLALDHGRNLRLIQGWVYRMEPVLRGWAGWISSHVGADDAGVPAWQKSILKRWGNVVVGRFGMRYPQWEKVGQAETSGVSCVTLSGPRGEDLGLLMQVGREIWQQSGTVEPRDAAPMITGYVMSVLRAKMWLLMQAMPAKSLLYLDTDAVLVLSEHRRQLSRLAGQPEFAGLRLKQSWKGLSIYGPRQVVTGEAVRVAGLPKTAKRMGRTEFEGEVTESLTAALQAGQAGVVRSVARQWKIAGTDTRRKGTGFGWTEPFHVGQTKTQGR